MARDYKLRSTGNAGGLVPLGPLGAPPVPAAPEPKSEPAPAPAGVARFSPGLPASVPQQTENKSYRTDGTYGTYPPPAEAPATTRPTAATGHQYPRPAGQQPLSLVQKAKLGSISLLAFEKATAADPDYLADMKAQGYTLTALRDGWRHSQCKAATAGHPAGQIDGLSKGTNAHYNTLLAHFCALAGMDVQSFEATLRDGAARGKPGRSGNSQEEIRQATYTLEQAMGDTGLGWPYVNAIIRNKHHTGTIADLTAVQIRNLAYTLRNRRSAQQGKGNPWHRNKSQRAQRADSRKPATPAPDTLF